MKVALFFAFILAMLVVMGCAATIPGVKITEQERTMCAQTQDCTVWSKEELSDLVRQVFKKAREAGNQKSI